VTALMVSVSTTAPSQTGSLRWRGMWPAGVILLLVMLGAVARPQARKSHPLNRRSGIPPRGGWRSLVVLGATVLAAALWASCGGGASARVTNPGTPTGSYTVTVTGTSAYNSTTLTHSVTLQLVVD
jgi:hypothetical protein